MSSVPEYDETCRKCITAILALMRKELVNKGYPPQMISAFISEKEAALLRETDRLWFLPEAKKTYDELRRVINENRK